MNWRDEVAEGFPEPRDDEPESLRRNIVDELADHLSCALVRELHFTPDEKTAVEKVLDRFGDPRKIARKLWFDSMKEKLMSQRITLATSILAAAASIAACVMVYFVVERTNSTNAALISQVGDTNKAIVDRLETMSKQPGGTASPEWSPVKARLVLEGPQSEPAVGYKVTLDSSGDNPEDTHIEEKTDTNGVADFGFIRFGRYQLRIETPSGSVSVISDFTVRIGRPTEFNIVCPTTQPETEVAISMNWPDDLRDKGFVVHGFFHRYGRTVGERYWILQPEPYQHLVILSEKGIVDLTGRKKEGGFSKVAQELQSQMQDPHPAENVTWLEGNYALADLEFFGANRTIAGRTPKSTNYWGQYAFSGYENADLARSPMSLGGGGFGVGGGGGLFSVPATEAASALLRSQPAMQFGGGGVSTLPPPIFEVKPGEQNVWKITLPEPVIESLRKQLAEQKQSPTDGSSKKGDPLKKLELEKVPEANPNGA